MVVTVKCGVESDFANMVITWTTYYGKDFTRIVLELIGALEQRIRVGNQRNIPVPFPR